MLLSGNLSIAFSDILESWCGIVPTMSSTGLGWQTYSFSERGTLEILEMPPQSAPGANRTFLQASVAARQPDVAILLSSNPHKEIEQLQTCQVETNCTCPILTITTAKSSHFQTSPLQGTLQDLRITSFDATAAQVLCELLPNPAKLGMARLLKAKDSQRQITNILLHSFATVCGVIGMQPIPLADLPILTSLQSLMVGSIAYCSGRSFQAKTIAEFLGAVGLNIGMGVLFREGARMAARLVPFWGNAVSGFVASTGTYAIGKAAIAYFVDEIPITSVRKIFSKWRKQSSQFIGHG